MKNIILIMVFFFSLTNCMAQIIPIEQEKYYRDINNDEDEDNDVEIANGTYFKDVNGVLNEFVGTWVGTFDGKTFEIVIEKLLLNEVIKYDILNIKYKITDPNGIVIDDTTNSQSRDTKFTATLFYPDYEQYHFYYRGEQSLCGQSGSIILIVNNNNPNSLSFSYRQLNDELFSQNCPNGAVEQILPIGTTTLTKQ